MKAAPSNTDSPLGRRIATATSSVCCFVYSLIGLIPLVGIPFAAVAAIRSGQVRKADSLDWNPADRYLSAARRIGPLGFLTNTIFLFLVGFVLPALWRDWTGCFHGST